MIVANAFNIMFSDPNCLLASLLFLVAFVLFFLYSNNKSSDAVHRQLISKLPSMNKTIWDAVLLPLDFSFIGPRDILPRLGEAFKEFGSLVHVQVLTRHYVMMNDPDDIKALLSSSQHIEKGPEYKMIEPWLNKGLLTSSNPKWHSRRKLLTNTFHFNILETYLPSINKHSRLLAENLIVASENYNKPIDDVESYITLCALDIVVETIMGVNLQTQKGKSTDYVKTVKTVSSILIKRIQTFWYWNDYIFYLTKIGRDFSKSLKSLHEYTENVIKERRKILGDSELDRKSDENGKKRVYSFLDLLIGISKENPGTMTDKDIREEVDTFLFGGHDTTSIAMTMALIHLGLDQNIQNSVREELNEIFGDSDRDATMEDLKAMQTLERVIKETLRFYPSASIISRTLEKPLNLKEYTIPAKTYMIVSPHLLHHAETVYPDPEKFDPDRFTPDECAVRHPYAFIPFSAGPRNCIGQKLAMYMMKTILSTVLRHARLETLGKQSDIVLSTQLVIRADHLPKVKITPI